MKKTLRILSLVFAAVLCIVFLVIFFSALFNKSGDFVYIVGVTGDVQVGTSTDLSQFQSAYTGMKLSSGNIVLTGKGSSCVLAYDKNVSNKGNYISVNNNSQVHVTNKNSQGGYNFFIADGSVICNMPNSDKLETNVSTRSYTFFAENTIAKVDYNYTDEVGKVFVFDGNPCVQIVQPSGAEGQIEKLLKNSVCAVQLTKDGTVGFGCLNTGFGLNELTAQDLRTMSGIANVWSERVSYSMVEFEQAFQTASDFADYTTATVAILGTDSEPVDTVVASSDEDSVPIVSDTTESTESTEESVPVNTTTFEPNYDNLPIYTEFTRPTLVDLRKDEPAETTTTMASSTVSTSSSQTTSVNTTTVQTTVKTTAQVTTTSKAVTTTTSVKPAVTTVPTVKVDPDATYTVIFTYSEDGNDYWAMQLVKRGQSAIAPEVPEIDGKYFVKWDKDFSYVTSDMTINGIFADGKKPSVNHTVSFYVDNKLWKTASVKDGNGVKLSEVPKSDGKTFAGWSDDISNVTSDMTVFALFSD